ncbi:MAG: asparagine synthetase B, partial [Alphaproteobacteria bacterium]|nr:asparagine synthetase B [Alphaproteobacteria bacterium]
SCPTGVWDSILKFAPGAMRMSRPGEKMHRLSHIYSQDTESFYHNLVSHWDQPQKVAVGADNPLDMMENTPIPASVSNTVERMQYLDTMTYLPGDILTKVDRASMAKSLEVRVPILDHRLVELSWRLPQKFKIREGQSKWILRQILDQHVPRKLFDRPKVGFSVPVQAWLRGPLKEWAHELLSKDSIDRYGLMKWQPINQKWQEHLSGKHDWQYQLWSALMLQSWCQKWL